MFFVVTYQVSEIDQHDSQWHVNDDNLRKLKKQEKNNPLSETLHFLSDVDIALCQFCFQTQTEQYGCRLSLSFISIMVEVPTA